MMMKSRLNAVLGFSLFSFLCGSYASADTWVPFDDPGILYQGRNAFSSDAAQFDWPCTGLTLQLFGQGQVTLSLDGGGNRFVLNVDGQERLLELESGEQDIVLADFAIAASHRLSLQKVTEAGYFGASFLMNQKPVKVYGLQLSETLRVESPVLPKLRLEFFGDSNLNGFGVETAALGVFGALGQLKDLEDCSKAYPNKIAQILHADIHVQAWSGKGVVSNAINLPGKHSETMPAYWARSLATDKEARWDFSRWTPDAVVVHLGGNDYYMHPYPNSERFKAAYRELLETMIASYAPASPALINVCGLDQHHLETNCPLVREASLELARDYPQVQYVELNPRFFAAHDWGSLHHLAASGHHKVAQILAPLIAGSLREAR